MSELRQSGQRDGCWAGKRARVTGGGGSAKRVGKADRVGYTKPKGQPRRALDTERAWQEFGFRAGTDLQTGLRQTIGWYRRVLAGWCPSGLMRSAVPERP